MEDNRYIGCYGSFVGTLKASNVKINVCIKKCASSPYAAIMLIDFSPVCYCGTDFSEAFKLSKCLEKKYSSEKFGYEKFRVYRTRECEDHEKKSIPCTNHCFNNNSFFMGSCLHNHCNEGWLGDKCLYKNCSIKNICGQNQCENGECLCKNKNSFYGNCRSCDKNSSFYSASQDRCICKEGYHYSDHNNQTCQAIKRKVSNNNPNHFNSNNQFYIIIFIVLLAMVLIIIIFIIKFKKWKIFKRKENLDFKSLPPVEQKSFD